MTDTHGDQVLKRTPLHGLHRRLGARLVPFAGYEMPLHYEGIIAEHLHARSQAVLFDVSHMGQATISGDDVAQAFESLVVSEISTLTTGQMRYTLLTNADGGIVDDLIVGHGGYFLSLVVNASRKVVDFEHIRAHLPGACILSPEDDRALLALQGPLAAAVIARFAPAARMMLFMTTAALKIGDIRCWVSRSGYTGEDGFEIAVDADKAEDLARMLLQEPEVKPAGLGARDTLRLEAGLCLYGSDIDETTTPVEAALSWTIGHRRRADGGFLGDARILKDLADGPRRRRVGIRLDGKAPARAHALITDAAETPIGQVTSGSFAPSLGVAIAMGYVRAEQAVADTEVKIWVRDRPLPGRIVPMPFVPHRYVR
jgi:aminomethyltransferase